MLPFLKRQNVAGLIISRRKPDGGTEEQHSEGNEDAGLDACSEALIRAIHAKDAKSVSAALRDAQEFLDNDTPDESEESDASPHSYDAQNAKAAKEQK